MPVHRLRQLVERAERGTQQGEAHREEPEQAGPEDGEFARGPGHRDADRGDK